MPERKPRPNASGMSGLIGAIADWFDSLPVGGKTLTGLLVAGLAAAGGTVAAFSNGGTDEGDCARTPLIHVYRPQRLKVLQTCVDVTGTVIAWRHEHDGDIHANMRTDTPGWVNAVNHARQHGLTVVEFVPLMPKPAKLFAGQRLKLMGTKVLDNQHSGWIECHPVFRVEDVSATSQANGAGNRPALAPPTEGEEKPR